MGVVAAGSRTAPDPGGWQRGGPGPWGSSATRTGVPPRVPTRPLDGDRHGPEDWTQDPEAEADESDAEEDKPRGLESDVHAGFIGVAYVVGAEHVWVISGAACMAPRGYPSGGVRARRRVKRRLGTRRNAQSRSGARARDRAWRAAGERGRPRSGCRRRSRSPRPRA